MMTVIRRAEIAGDLVRAGQRPGADSGDPQTSVLEVAGPTTVDVGVWECTPGGWPVVDRRDTEVAYLLSGSAVITDDASGEQYSVGAGDLVVLPAGWSGRWDVISTVRKGFVIG